MIKPINIQRHLPTIKSFFSPPKTNMGQLTYAFQITVISTILIIIMGTLNLVKGQITTPCTTSMITNFTPCANFITGSSSNGLAPSSSCCDSLRSLMSNSIDCACLVISANAPIPLPINSVLALFLPQACNINELPLQCKASGSPVPAPGPAMLGSNDQSLPPIAESPLSPQASEAPNSETSQPTLAPLEAKSKPLKKNKNSRKLQEYSYH
ncbi:hypothetical protein HN51_030771 [Arachis hypogaea]